MHYTLIVTSNHLTTGRKALNYAHGLLEQKHIIDLVYFLFDGAYVANRFIDMPTDEFNLAHAWSKLAQDYNIKLAVCSASGLRRGISKESIATNFVFGSIGELVACCDNSDQVVCL